MRKFIISFIITLLISIFIFLLIILCLANSWKNRPEHFFKDRSMFEGPDDKKVNNLIVNALNQLISLYIKPEYDTPFLPWEDLYPKVQLLQDNWKAIQQEAKNVMNVAPSYHELDSMNTGLATHDNHYWKTFVFKYYQGFNKKNCEKCPITANLLMQLPEINLAMFSILEEGKILYPHHGPWRGIMRIHLGLMIPNSQPTITVGSKTYSWKEGELVAFDDTYLHSVNNPKPGGPRIILFIDIHRPDVPLFFHKISNLASTYFQEVNKNTEKKSIIK